MIDRPPDKPEEGAAPQPGQAGEPSTDMTAATNGSAQTNPNGAGVASSPHSTIGGERGEWFRQFVAAVARRAARPGRFTCYDVARDANLAEPAHPNHWGSAMGICRAEGIVVPVAAVPSSRPRTARSLVRLWVGARFVEQSEDAA